MQSIYDQTKELKYALENNSKLTGTRKSLTTVFGLKSQYLALPWHAKTWTPFLVFLSLFWPNDKQKVQKGRESLQSKMVN